MYVCPATGHAIAPHQAHRACCGQHGVRVFSECSTCQAGWRVEEDVTRRGRTTMFHDARVESGPLKALSYCVKCGTPAPWLNRNDLTLWVRHQVQASTDLPSAARVELMAILDRLKEMDPSDDKAIPVWKRLHELAPKVYNATKPMRDALMSEGVKRALEALFGGG